MWCIESAVLLNIREIIIIRILEIQEAIQDQLNSQKLNPYDKLMKCISKLELQFLERKLSAYIT